MRPRLINFFGPTLSIREVVAWATDSVGRCTCLRVSLVDPGCASRWLHRTRLPDASIAADSVAQSVRFFRYQSTDLLFTGSPAFLAHRVEQFLSNHLIDTPDSYQSRRALVFFLLHGAVL